MTNFIIKDAEEAWAWAKAEAVVIESDIATELEKIALLFEADIWPFVKAGLLTLLSTAGKAGLAAGVDALIGSTPVTAAAAAAAVGTAILGAVSDQAAAVAETEGAKAAAAVAADPHAAGIIADTAAKIEASIPVPTNGSDLPHPAAEVTN